MRQPVSLIIIGVTLPITLFQFDSTQVPLRELWLIVSGILFSNGIYRLVQNLKKRKTEKKERTSKLVSIIDLKLFGQKIKVTVDNSEIKTRRYAQEIINENPGKENYLDQLYDPNRTHETEEVEQTYILFYKEFDGRQYKFISDPVNVDELHFRLKFFEQNGVDLYVDKNNPKNYYFDLQSIKAALAPETT